MQILFKLTRYLFLPFIPVYLAVFCLIRMLSKPVRVKLPVICVGNITTGGTGKTPCVIHLAEILKDAGFKPGVIGRGYRGSMSNSGGLVSDGKSIILSYKEAGEEAYLTATRLPGVPVAVAADRIIAVRLLQDNSDIDIILMDDGFQNNRIQKDICIIGVDALNPFGNDFILPAGDLREPKSALKRADFIFLNKSDLVEASRKELLIKKIEKISGKKHVYKTGYTDEYVFPVSDPEKKLSPELIKNCRVLLFSGIGNPDSFYSTISKYEAAYIEHVKFTDHHIYDNNDIAGILKKSEKFDYVLLTEKDYVKISDFKSNDKFYIFGNSITIENEEIFKQVLLNKIEQIRKN